MKVWYDENGGWSTDDILWFMQNFKLIYHLSCMLMDGAE